MIAWRRFGTRLNQSARHTAAIESNPEKEKQVLELYHNINSVCAQKVQIALLEKNVKTKERLLKFKATRTTPPI
jgi:hypothetical protein